MKKIQVQWRFKRYPEYWNISLIWLAILLWPCHTVAQSHMVAATKCLQRFLHKLCRVFPWNILAFALGFMMVDTCFIALSLHRSLSLHHITKFAARYSSLRRRLVEQPSLYHPQHHWIIITAYHRLTVNYNVTRFQQCFQSWKTNVSLLQILLIYLALVQWYPSVALPWRAAWLHAGVKSTCYAASVNTGL